MCFFWEFKEYSDIEKLRYTKKQRTKNNYETSLDQIFNVLRLIVEYKREFNAKTKLLTLIRRRGAKWPSLSENRDFSGPEPPLDLKPVCKFMFVRCGPVEKNQRALSVLVWSWWSDKVREHIFKKNYLRPFSTKWSIFQQILRGWV